MAGFLVLIALCMFALNAAAESTVSKSSYGSAPTGYAPSGGSHEFSLVVSIAGNGSRLYVRDTPTCASYRYVDTTSDKAQPRDMQYYYLTSSIRDITGIRIVHDKFFSKDNANKEIAMISNHRLVRSYGFYNSTKLRLFHVSPGARWLAMGGLPNSKYIDYIDVHDLDAYGTPGPNGIRGDGFVYRIDLAGLQTRSFAFDKHAALLHVPIGINNTVSVLKPEDGAFRYNQEFNLPVALPIHNIAVNGDQYVLIDCERAVVGFYNTAKRVPFTSYTVQQFESSQCTESVTAIGERGFAVLDGPKRVKYFKADGGVDNDAAAAGRHGTPTFVIIVVVGIVISFVMCVAAAVLCLKRRSSASASSYEGPDAALLAMRNAV